MARDAQAASDPPKSSDRRRRSRRPPPSDLTSFELDPPLGDADPVVAAFAHRIEPCTTATLQRHAAPFTEEQIDPDVARVVRRLTKAGYQAYLVGGCVRDLLLGKAPKDFDVATSARPEDVRSIFRNSRIIGRRFRLVHVLFSGRKVIEVATFRRNPNAHDPTDEAASDSDLVIRNDNAFGTIEEDASRRDFTINALFYDLERREILDFFNGMTDIGRQAVRTIGDPVLRFKEDPVRILRAIKFAGKLGLGIDPDVADALVATRETLALAAKPRLFEEILRLLRGGAARRSMFLSWDFGVLHVLLPELASYLDDVSDDKGPPAQAFRLWGELDRRIIRRGEPYDDIVLWTLLLLLPLQEMVGGSQDRIQAGIDFCDPIIERLSVHRRIADAMRRIVAVLPKLYAGKLGKFVRTELFDQAVAVAEISMGAQGDTEGLRRLERALAAAGLAPRLRSDAPLPLLA